MATEAPPITTEFAPEVIGGQSWVPLETEPEINREKNQKRTEHLIKIENMLKKEMIRTNLDVSLHNGRMEGAAIADNTSGVEGMGKLTKRASRASRSRANCV
jgi:hypothetical protein